MKSAARILIMFLAVFLIINLIESTTENTDLFKRNFIIKKFCNLVAYADTTTYSFNLLNIPELKTYNPPQTAISVVNIPTACDPRLDMPNSPHRERFIPASEIKPPETAISIPIVNNKPQNYYDNNEWEQERVFNSNLYTDTTIYTNHIDGDEKLSSKDEGEFYEENLHYDLFSTNNSGDTLSVILDTTTTNDKRPYKEEFNINQLTVRSETNRSLLVFGHAFPQMSPMTMTQNMVGFYGMQKYDNTKLSGFAGYYALTKDDLKTPRKVAGVRIEHSKDASFKIGLNVAGTDDTRSNAGADLTVPSLSNKVYSIDMQLKPTENIFLNAEIAQSNTDFNKNDNYGAVTDNAYKIKGGYKRENFKFEGGIEQAGTSFLTLLGQSPRDERAYYANFYYELNKYISAKFANRISRDNLANYQRSTIIRDQPELQFTLKPSDYYKDLRIDFHYLPLHEYSENSNFMNHYRDIMAMEVNHKAGQMRYFAELTQTIDKDDVNILNDHDIQKFNFNLTWEYDKFRSVYTGVSMEKLSYKRAGGIDENKFYTFGGRSMFHNDITLGLDFMREEADLNGENNDSTHNRINMFLSKEYSNASKLTLEFEGSDNQFDISERNFKDYTAKLRYLRAF